MKHRILIEFSADTLPDDFLDQIAVRVYGHPAVDKKECTVAFVGDVIQGVEVTNTLKVKKLDPRAIIPKYQTAGAACFDLHAIAEKVEGYEGLPLEFFGGATFKTGLAFEVPENYVMLIFSRSGQGFNHDTRLANCVGIADSDYRGEIMVRLVNDGDSSFTVSRGDRIAQAMLIPVQQWAIEEVQELNQTERGANGFGSTGVKA